MNECANVRVALVFKDFAYWVRSSCVGLNVAGYANAEYLNKQFCEEGQNARAAVFPVRHNIDLVNQIDKYNEEHFCPLTDVIISAPWLTRHEIKSLIEAYPDTCFTVICHSNVGFLQSDLSAMELIRCYHELSEWYPNLRIGGNSCRFVEWLGKAYGWDDVVCLPNMYPLVPPPWNSLFPIDGKCWGGGLLKIGAFGAVRLEKNFMTAAGAALAIHSILDVPIEFHMLKGGDYNSVSKAIRDMFYGLDDVELIEHSWSYWDDFIGLIGSMDLLLQPSYTESFNMVTADGISVGVPSVVSTAVQWAPDEWKADSDNALEVAEVGISLLRDHGLRSKGRPALEKHNRKSLKHWLEYLELYEPSLCERILTWLRSR